MRPTATGTIIPSIKRSGESIAISSLGMPYSTSLRVVAASVTAKAGADDTGTGNGQPGQHLVFYNRYKNGSL